MTVLVAGGSRGALCEKRPGAAPGCTKPGAASSKRNPQQAKAELCDVVKAE